MSDMQVIGSAGLLAIVILMVLFVLSIFVSTVIEDHRHGDHGFLKGVGFVWAFIGLVVVLALMAKGRFG